MNKKVFSVMGMIVSLALVLCGILSMCGNLGGDTSYPGSAPYSYDSGYATFGGDYYTYSVNNTAETADAARTTAYNLDDIAGFLKTVCGLFMIGSGLIAFCAFGIVLSTCPAPDKSIPEAESFFPDFSEEESSPENEEDFVEEETSQL